MFQQISPIPNPCDTLIIEQGCGVPGSVLGSVASSGFDAVANSFGEAAEKVLLDVVTSWTEVPSGAATNTDVIKLLQNDLRVVTTFVAAMALILAAVRLAFSKRSDDAATTFFGLFRLIAVSSAGVLFLNVGLTAGDEFSEYILNRSTGGQFGNSKIIFAGGSIGAGLVFLLGLLAVITGLMQIALLFFRSVAVVILAAVWPVAAAASIHPQGEMLWKKVTAWLIAFVLYKPIAATCYGVAFRMLNDGAGEPSVLSTVQGLLILVVAVAALPALIKLLMPVTSGMSMGPSSVGVAAGAAATVATGAVAVAGMSGAAGMAGGAGAATAGAPLPPGPSGSTGGKGSPGGTGSSGPSGGSGPSGSSGGKGSSGAGGAASAAANVAPKFASSTGSKDSEAL